MQDEAHHELNNLWRREVLAEFFFVDERVSEKLAKNFVEYVGTSEVESIRLTMQRLEAVNQFLSEFFLLRLEL